MRAGINAAISFWNLSMLEEQEARETLVAQMDESLVDGSAERLSTRSPAANPRIRRAMDMPAQIAL
jgi:hypothetical protein